MKRSSIVLLMLIALVLSSVAQQKSTHKTTGTKTVVEFVVNAPDETAPFDNPNTDADESMDGICEDANGNCTLTAATMEAEYMNAAVIITFQSSMTITLTPDGGSEGASLGFLFSGSKILAGNNTITINGSPFGGPLDMEDYCEISGISFDNIPLTLQNGNTIKGCSFNNTGFLPVGLISIDGSNNIIGGPNPSDRNVFKNGKTYAIMIAHSAGDGKNQIVGNYIGLNESGTVSAGNEGGILLAGNNGEGKNLIEGNVISGNKTNGIGIMSSDSNVIRDNKIGTNASGTLAVGNLQNGILLANASHNTIEGNILSGNVLSGLVLSGDAERPIGSSFNTVKFNFIGVNKDTLQIPNGEFGVQLLNNANDNIIGSTLATDLDTNVIAYNTRMGILLWRDSLTAGSFTPQRNIFRRNRMYRNGDPGIMLVTNAQENIPRATVDSIHRMPEGDLIVHGKGTPKVIADVYLADPNASKHGEGKQWLAKGAVDDSGFFAVNVGVHELKCDYITVLQTDNKNNTSANSYNYGLVPNMVLLTQSCEPGLFGAVPYADNKYSVHIDWKGMPMVGEIEFVLNGHTKSGTINGDLAEVEYNMNQSVVGNNTLTWTLTTCDNRSATGINQYQFCGNPVPGWLDPVTALCGGGHMKYKHTQTFPDIQGAAAGMGVPSSMAFIGGQFLSFVGAPSFTTTLNIPGESEPIEANAAFEIGEFRTNVSISGTANTTFAGCTDVDLSGIITLTANVAKDYSYGINFGAIPCPSIPGLEQACQMANALSHLLRVGATLSGQITGTATLSEGITITGGSGGASLALRPFLDVFPFHASGTGALAFAFSVPDFSVTSVTPSLVLTISESITGSSKSWTFPNALPLAEADDFNEKKNSVAVFPFIPADIQAIAPDTMLEQAIPWNARPAFAAGPNGVKAFSWTAKRISGGKNVYDIMLKYFNGTEWMPTVELTHDNNVDRNPDIAIDNNGTIMVCWEKNSSATAYPESLHYSSAAMKNYEIAYYTRTTGIADVISSGTFGAPGIYDASPLLACGTDGTTVMMWQANNGESMYGTETAPTKILSVRTSSGTQWTQVDTVATGQSKLFQWKLAVHDEANILLALAKDTQGDLSTGDDWEIFTIRKTNGVWGNEQRLTTNTKMEYGVNAAYAQNGTPIVTWMRDTSIIGSVGATTLSQEVWLSNAGMGFFTNAFAIGKDTMALFWNEGSSIVTSTSPVEQRSWSNPRFIHFTTDVQRSVHAQFDGTGALHVGFQQSPYSMQPGQFSDSGSLQLISLSKLSIPLEVKQNVVTAPTGFALFDAYPNPFNASSVIRFRLPNQGYTVLTVTNTLGREVARLVDGQLNEGEHSITFNAERFASGVYFYTLRSGVLIQTKKMILLK